MQQAKITVSGIARDDERLSRLKTVNIGTFIKKNGYCYARYEETEVSGMSGTVTTLKWNASQVFLIRHGAYEMRQEFVEGNDYISEYRTPYMVIPLKTKTKKVWVRKLSYGWKIRLEYELGYAAEERNRITTTIEVDLREGAALDSGGNRLTGL